MPTLTNNLDAKQLEIVSGVIHKLAAPPATPVQGQIWFNTSAGRLQTYTAGAVVDVANLDDITSADLSGFATETYADNAATVAAAAATAALVGAAPEELNMINELAAALGNDENFAATVTTALAARTRKHAETIGDGNATTFDVAHGLSTEDITPSVRYAEGTKAFVLADPLIVDADTIRLEFATPPATGEFRVVVTG